MIEDLYNLYLAQEYLANGDNSIFTIRPWIVYLPSLIRGVSWDDGVSNVHVLYMEIIPKSIGMDIIGEGTHIFCDTWYSLALCKYPYKVIKE